MPSASSFSIFTAHWLLAGFLVAVAVVVSIVRGLAAARFVQVNYRSSPLRREAGYWSGLLSSRETGPELRLFGLADHLMGLWRGVFRRHVAEMDRGRRQVALGFLTQIAVKQVAMLIGAIALVILASTGQISIGQLVALLYGLSQFEGVTNTFGWSSASLVEDWSSIAHCATSSRWTPNGAHSIVPLSVLPTRWVRASSSMALVLLIREATGRRYPA